MRVKAVPRRKQTQNCTWIDSMSDEDVSKFDNFENSSTCDEDEGNDSEYITEVLDMSSTCKKHPLHPNLLNRTKAGPSSSDFSDSVSEKDTSNMIPNNDDDDGDDNNNHLLMHHPVASVPSSREYFEHSFKEQVNFSANDDDAETAVNLSKKDGQCVEDESISFKKSGDKLKDTFLYQIMTDPTFLDTIQKNKKPKKFVCQFCKQEFMNDGELTNHLNVKKDDANQVVCCACKKAFAQKRYLRYHQRCHSERAKFTCDICTKKYTRMDNLTRHNVFHVNPDKYSCTSCEKTFARKDLLNKHQKCHDNKFRFFCDTCEKYYKGPLTLDNHKKIFHSVS